jgi:4-amino-4-deoxy-L-arabinose transferase-like glycosyltransferase
MRLRVLLFLLLWFAYGAAINSNNLLDFDLQQIGVEALVERGHFYLEGSTSPQLQTKGDVFEYNGHKYAAKQPGQFIAGSIVYFLLHKLGLSYVNHYLLTAALVTFFTTSLVLAASGVALFALAREMAAHGRGLFWPLAATISYTLATTTFAYSGIAHHDVLATGYLVIAFYFIFQLSRASVNERTSYLYSGGAGLLLGLTITTSMLPFFMVILCVVYSLSLRRWKLQPVFLIGLLAGLLPLFIYDAVSFGNPLRLANTAGARVFDDTFWHFNPNNLGNKLVLYARALVAYVPVFAAGVFGLSYYPRWIKRNPEFLTLVGVMIVLAAFIFNINSDGDCQFGPRYLLPAMPFACLGISGYSYLSRFFERKLAALAVVATAAVSFVVNLVGALGGAMSCPHGQNAFWTQFVALRQGHTRSYPLAAWLILPLLTCMIVFVLNLFASQRAGTSLPAQSQARHS